MNQSETVLQYEKALIALNDLIAREQDESPAGENLRDEIERLFWKVSDSEKELMGGLAADLYILQNDEIFEPLQAEETPESIASDLQGAWERQEVEALLRLLRKSSPLVSREALASLRSYAYGKLGLRESASRFAFLSARLCLTAEFKSDKFPTAV